jgi:hypothetical protein
MIRVRSSRLPSVTPIQDPAPAKRTLLIVEVPPRTVATLAAVDALARLQLAARRAGLEVRIVPAGTQLRALIRLVGLEEVLVGGPGVLSLEPGGQAEAREGEGAI